MRETETEFTALRVELASIIHKHFENNNIKIVGGIFHKSGALLRKWASMNLLIPRTVQRAIVKEFLDKYQMTALGNYDPEWLIEMVFLNKL